ncbi:methionine synthase II (cobalamin-independent) [Oxalobacteraceae bacterium GrIS 1.11]
MHTIHTHIPGFPCGGAARVGQSLRARHWALQKAAGLDWVSVGDSDEQVAHHIALLGCVPARCADLTAWARRRALAGADDAVHGLERRPWFDTDAHYLVPEFTPATVFSLACERLFEEVGAARALGHAVKTVLLGPLTFLWLGKAAGFERLALLEQLLPVYGALLDRLKHMQVEWVQIDEPILGLDLPPDWRNAYERVYWQLNQVGVKLMLATYFAPLKANLGLACRLPVAGLHIDGVRAAHEIHSVHDWLPSHKVLSVGIVDGRDSGRGDRDAALAMLAPLLDRRDQLWLASSCSLRHLPPGLVREKLAELAWLKQALEGGGTRIAA